MWQFLLVLCLLQFYLGLVWFLPGTKIATDLFEGDIKLKRKTSQAEPRGDILVQRNVVTDTSKQWDPSAIPYQLNTTTLSKHRSLPTAPQIMTRLFWTVQKRVSCTAEIRLLYFELPHLNRYTYRSINR